MIFSHPPPPSLVVAHFLAPHYRIMNANIFLINLKAPNTQYQFPVHFVIHRGSVPVGITLSLSVVAHCRVNC